jgi:hypothetical protein
MEDQAAGDPRQGRRRRHGVTCSHRGSGNDDASTLELEFVDGESALQPTARDLGSDR